MPRNNRIQKVTQKALDFKGFGSLVTTNNPHWFEIEYCYESQGDLELVELHWLKVAEPDKTVKQKIRFFMEKADFCKDGAGECDFLALLHLLISIEKPIEGVNCVLLYRATKEGQSGTFKDFIAKIYIDKPEQYDSLIKQLVFKYCQVTQVVPSEVVTIKNRKLIKT